jgi:chromate reductase, NAD(P)H dehydrogenase (quinone)
MAAIKVAVLGGRLRKDSFNRQLARAVEQLAPSDFSFEHIRIDNLPLYDQDFDHDYPAVCQELKEQIKAADALLFVTPEYNRSIPVVVKNAIDIASRPDGESAFAGKPGAVIGISIGAADTALAQQHLRNVLTYLDVAVMEQPEVFLRHTEQMFDAEGNIAHESTKTFLQGFVQYYVAWVHEQLHA